MAHRELTIENTENIAFVQRLRALVRDGFGITPFLGSGCSSASGILMGQEFTDYLGYVVYRCLCKESEDDASHGRRWDISRQGWPDRPNQDQVTEARRWALGVFKRICGNGKGIHITDDPEHRVQSFQVSGGTTPALLARMLASPPVPPFLRSPKLIDEGESILSIRESLEERRRDHRFFLRSSNSPTSYAAICEKALRSLCDWRATLQFLSTLRSSHDPELLSMEEPDQSVIDSFNVHITRDKKPNLTHMMIAQLSMSARIRVVLTTNFDSLLETAFESFGRQLAVIPVGIHDTLPHPDLIHQNDCVVKLHGDCHETRADFTLDDEPAPEDKRRFFHYVRGKFPAFEFPAGTPEERFIPSQLLVIGYSGSDTRCNDMIKYVLDSDKDATVYWICHSQRDLDRLTQRFSEEDYSGGRIIATVTERPDLLLYDFYQKLTLTLPSAGLTYQFPDRVLPAKDPQRKAGQRCSATDQGEHLAGLLTQRGRDAQNRPRGPIVIATGSSGVLTVIHEAFNLLSSRGKQRIWLELEDFPTIPVVGAEIYTSLAERTGSLPLSHMKPLPRDIWKRKKTIEKQAAGSVRRSKESNDESKTRREAWHRFFLEACDELGLSPHSWVIGFYGRNGPGGCCGWEENQYWTEANYAEFHDLLDGLSLAGFSMLYAPYNEQRWERDKERAAEVIKMVFSEKEKGGARSKGDFSYNIPRDEFYRNVGFVWDNDTSGDHVRSVPNGDFYTEYECMAPAPESQRFKIILQSIWRDLLEPSLCGEPPHADLNKIDWRRQATALYSATLYRQSRHFSAFLNDAVFRCPQRFNLHNFDNDTNRVNVVEEWLRILSKAGMFFMKPGGFAWAYRDTRLAFRYIIEQLDQHPRVRALGVLRDVRGFRARGNFHIGEWYAKAHRVTRHPMPMMEALHHFYQAAIYAHEAHEGSNEDEGADQTVPKKTTASAGKSDKLLRSRDVYRRRLFLQSLTAIHHTLRTGVESLRYWSSNSAIEYLCDNFTEQNRKGQPRGVSRLEEVLEELIPESRKRGAGGRAGSAGEEDSLRRHAKTLIDRIAREIATIRSKLRDRDPIVHLDNLSLEDNGPEPLDAPLPHMDSLAPGWMDVQFKPIADIVACATKRMKDASEAEELDKKGEEVDEARWKDMGETLWKEVGHLETNYFSRQLQAFRDPRLIHQKVQHLVEWSFIFIRRAKRQARAGDPHSPGIRAKQCFLMASVLDSVAIDFCRLLPVELEAFATQEKAKALALYGLAQGHLGRFDEANRRLSESRAVIRAMRTEDRHVPLGITELRRAEVLCLQACECGAILDAAGRVDQDWILSYPAFQNAISEDLIQRLSASQGGSASPKLASKRQSLELKNILERHGLFFKVVGKEIHLFGSGGNQVERTLSEISRVRQARIGDAWRCVEEARREFVGRTHSERWWGRLYALEMRVFGEAGAAIETCYASHDHDFEAERYRMLLCRSRRDVAHHLSKIWKKGLGVAGDGEQDVYERCRTTLLYRFALSIAESQGVHSISDEDLQRAKDSVAKFLKKERERDFAGFLKGRKLVLPPGKELQALFIGKFVSHMEVWVKTSRSRKSRKER